MGGLPSGTGGSRPRPPWPPPISPLAPAARSAAKNRLKTTYSVPMTPSHGSAISPANRPNDRPLAANARRFVRFDTGSSSDPEFDRCVQA